MPSQHLSLSAEHVPSIMLLNLLLMVGTGTVASKMGFSELRPNRCDLCLNHVIGSAMFR